MSNWRFSWLRPASNPISARWYLILSLQRTKNLLTLCLQRSIARSRSSEAAEWDECWVADTKKFHGRPKNIDRRYRTTWASGLPKNCRHARESCSWRHRRSHPQDLWDDKKPTKDWTQGQCRITLCGPIGGKKTGQIIVKFATRNIRERVFQARKELKDVTKKWMRTRTNEHLYK